MWLGSGSWLWAEMRYTTTQLGCKVHCKSYNPLSSSKSEFVLILEFIERRKERKRLREKPGSATSCTPHWGWSCNPSCICPDGTATVGCMGQTLLSQLSHTGEGYLLPSCGSSGGHELKIPTSYEGQCINSEPSFGEKLPMRAAWHKQPMTQTKNTSFYLFCEIGYCQNELSQYR